MVRGWRGVPMIALCLLLCGGCGEQEAETDPRDIYQTMTGCEMTAVVTCEQSGLEWSAVLTCTYVPDGESTVEVAEPLELAGVRAVIRETDWSLEYGALCLDAGPLSSEDISPAAALPRMLNALRDGWLLEQDRETWGEVPCVRLALDQTGSAGGSVVTTLWLRETDDTPLRGEISVNGEMILTAEFTRFVFCDKITETAETD